MGDLQTIRSLCTILDKYVNRVNGNIHFGDYPIVGSYNSDFLQFSQNRLHNEWYLPFGIPFIYHQGRRRNEPSRHIAYLIGERLYVHNKMFREYVGDVTRTKFYNPQVDAVIELAKGGWSLLEKKKYEDLLWKMALKTTSPEFHRLFGFDFDVVTAVDGDILWKDGWLVNRIFGDNAFYGITECGVKDDDLGGYKWYNKYFVKLNISGGGGIKTFGELHYHNGPHPHVNEVGDLCRGGFEKPLQGHIYKGEITQFFVLMKQFLTHYYRRDAYYTVPLQDSEVENLNVIDGDEELLEYYKNKLVTVSRRGEVYDDDDDDLEDGDDY